MTKGLLACVTLLVGCATATPRPVAVDAVNDACRHCRMIVSNVRLAAEIVRPGDEPLIFDEIGCLRDYLSAHPLPADALAYVVDHRSGQWVPAASAVYTKTTTVRTPMGSGLVAHVDVASREADSSARSGQSLEMRSILGTTFATGGSQ